MKKFVGINAIYELISVIKTRLNDIDDRLQNKSALDHNHNTLYYDRDEIDTKVNDLKKYVGDGKKLVANAITDKGVTTATDATFTTMVENISKITTNPNLQSKIAILSTEQQKINADEGYDGLSYVTVPAVSGTAGTGDVLSGKTFNSETAGIDKTGSMANKGGITLDADATQDDDYTYLSIPVNGFYNTASKLRIPNSSIINVGNYILDPVFNTHYGSDPNVTKGIQLGGYGCESALLVIIGASTNANTEISINSISGCTWKHILDRNIAYGSLSVLAKLRIVLLTNMTSSVVMNIWSYCRTVNVELIKIN